MEPMQSDIGPKFRRINDEIRKTADADMQNMQLTMEQSHVLGFLRFRMDKKTSQKDIEEHLHVTHPTVNGLLKRLEEKGFIRMERDKADRRVKNVYLTGKENELFEEMQRKREKIEGRILAGFQEEEAERLREYLDRIIENLGAAEGNCHFPKRHTPLCSGKKEDDGYA